MRDTISSKVGNELWMETCTAYVVVEVGAVGSGSGSTLNTGYNGELGRSNPSALMT
jgi:hypothetical protein